MQNKSFALAMSKIVGEAEAERQRETEHAIRTERRARIFGHVRGVFILLFLAAALLFGYNYRDALTKFYNPKPVSEAEGKASTTLEAARQTAATRDLVVDEVTK